MEEQNRPPEEGTHAPMSVDDPPANGTAVDAAKAPVDTEERKDDDHDKREGRRKDGERSRSATPRDADRRSRSRSRSRNRRRRSRSRSRDRRRRYRSRSRSYDRRRRSRSRDRDRRRRHSRERRSRRDYSSDEGGGYGRRRRGGGGSERARMATVEDPFAHLRTAAAPTMDPAEVARKMQEQQLRARHEVLQQQAASAVAAASKTQREVYVGGLVPGVVTEAMLRELFRTTLSAAFPDKVAQGQDPVIRINMAPEGKYCFMELLSSEMASACLQLTGQVPLMGSMLSIGRPAGYVDPARAQAASLAAAEALARFQADSQAARIEAGTATEETLAAEETPFLEVGGMITADMLQSDAEYGEVVEEVRGEFELHGSVLRVVVPRPEDPEQAGELIGTGPYGKVYVQYLDAEGAKAAKAAVAGRLFAGQTVTVRHMQAKDFMTAVGQKS